MMAKYCFVCFYSEYGFAEKVVEGMSIVVNSIVVKIEAKAFNTSFELWQLQGYSVNPKWQQSDLRFTRITDPERGEVWIHYFCHQLSSIHSKCRNGFNAHDAE